MKKLFLFFTLSLFLVGCSKSMDDYPLSNLRAMVDFSVKFYHNSDNNIFIEHTGTIDETNHIVTLSLPTDADVSKLKPTVLVAPWAKVSPASLEVVDFSKNPVAKFGMPSEDGKSVDSIPGYSMEYTVTAQSGKETVYTIYIATNYIYDGADIWKFYLTDIIDSYGDPYVFNPSSYQDNARIYCVVDDQYNRSSLHTSLDLSPSSHRSKIEVCESNDKTTFRPFLDGSAIDYTSDTVIFRVTSEKGRIVNYNVSVKNVKDTVTP